VQATTIILVIEKKLSRRRIDQKIVSLLKQDCKCNSTKKSARPLLVMLEMGDRRNSILTDFAYHLAKPHR